MRGSQWQSRLCSVMREGSQSISDVFCVGAGAATEGGGDVGKRRGRGRERRRGRERGAEGWRRRHTSAAPLMYSACEAIKPGCCCCCCCWLVLAFEPEPESGFWELLDAMFAAVMMFEWCGLSDFVEE
jgi:hypothetical protein